MGLHYIIIVSSRKKPNFQGHMNAVTAYKTVTDFIFRKHKLTGSESRKLQQHKRQSDILT